LLWNSYSYKFKM